MASDNRMYINDNRFTVKPTQGSTPSKNQGIVGTITDYSSDKNIKTPTKAPTTTTTSTSTTDLGSYLANLQAQKAAAVQGAYENAINNINNAYNSAADSYGNIYNNGVNTLNGSYNNSQNKINNQAEDSMKEAYVNKMLSMKNLSQKLAAQGISGGASESAVAGLLNNYGNARNGIQRTWNDNLADLEQTYNTNLNDLYSAYQAQMAQLENLKAQQINQAEMNLANMVADGSGSLYEALLSMSPTTLQKALSGAVSSQDAYTPVDTVATNTVAPVNTQQVNDIGGTLTNWSRERAILDGAGATDEEKIRYMLSNGFSPQDALIILNGAYGV